MIQTLKNYAHAKLIENGAVYAPDSRSDYTMDSYYGLVDIKLIEHCQNEITMNCRFHRRNRLADTISRKWNHRFIKSPMRIDRIIKELIE